MSRALFFFSSRRRHTRLVSDWSSDVCSSDLHAAGVAPSAQAVSWLANAQCDDGGWQFDKPYRPARDNQHCVDANADPEDPFRSEADATALAVQALDALGSEPA